MSKFSPGQVVATPGALEAFEESFYTACLDKHLDGDWGDALSDEDKASNDSALENGERLLSAYLDPSGHKLWIITEWDRSVTTLLLPSDY